MKSTTRSILWDTGEAKVPVIVRELSGGRPGPTLAVIGGEHGIEINGPAGIDAVCRDLDGQPFAGTLIAVPVVSPLNLRDRRHVYRQSSGVGYTNDMPYNSWAKWPGKPGGDPAERLCALVWETVVSRADVVLNFHCWTRTSASCLLSGTRVRGMAELAYDFGLPFCDLSCEKADGTLHSVLLAQGRRAALIEMLSQWWIEPLSLTRVRQGVLNAMASLGMLKRPIVRPPLQFRVGANETLIRSPAQGLFIPLREIEQTVKRGDVLGYLFDPETGRRTDIATPVDGALWLVSRCGANADVTLEGLHAYAEPGDLLALVKEVIETRTPPAA